MLIIEEGDEVVLSPPHHRLHNISVLLYDQMSYLPKHEEYHWFQQAPEGVSDTPEDALARDISQALMVDFLNFMYESLNAAKKGKVTVAYALLRKPMTDLLLLLEQILVNRHEFVVRFTKEDSAKYDPSVANLNKQAIISEACAKLKLRELLDEEFIHTMRYDKGSKVGVGGSSAQAMHIVTNGKHHATPNAYFNFVFDAVESLEKYWTNYYHVVTYLMCYAAAVMDEIAFSFMPEHFSVLHLKNIQRFLFITELHVDHTNPQRTPEQDTMCAYLSVALAHTCKNCGHGIVFTQADHTRFSHEMVMACPLCKENQLMDIDFGVKFHEAWTELVPM